MSIGRVSLLQFALKCCIYRAEEVLRLVNYKEPSMTPIERAEADELKKMDNKISEMKMKLQELKKKSELQTEYIEKGGSTEKKKEMVHLKSDQEKTIQNNLAHMYVLLSFHINIMILYI